MKNKWFFGLCVLFVFGLVFAACDDGNGNSGSDPFNGTWIGTISGKTIKVVAKNGSFNEYHDDVEGTRGTYTFSGKTVTVKIIEMNPGVVFASLGGTDAWFTYANLDEEYKEYMGSDTSKITISGNKFKNPTGGFTMTKQ